MAFETMVHTKTQPVFTSYRFLSSKDSIHYNDNYHCYFIAIAIIA